MSPRRRPPIAVRRAPLAARRAAAAERASGAGRLRPRLLVLAATLAIVASACGSPAPNPSTAAATNGPPRSPAASAAQPSATAAAGTASPAPSASFSPFGSPGAAATLAYPHRTVFVQLFEWRWADVAAECEQWLGPHGFAAVQVSPPQEHAVIDDATNRFPWWERYQAVSYKLESRSGTRAEFADMVKRCRAAGIEVYADVILNHMAAGSGTGSAGTTYTKYDYPGLYAPKDFHANANPAYPKVLCDHSMNTGSPEDVQTCELSGLADLRTEEPAVQARLAAYLADLYGLGVRGFRIDAAKHIDQTQLAAILTRLRAKLPAGAAMFVDQEVSDFGGDAVPKTLYYPTGSVDDFIYALSMTAAFVHSDSTISSLQHLDTAPYIAPSGKAVVFVDNHDTQRGRIPGVLLSYRRGELYVLATTFMLAYPFGYPRLMSGYVFSDTEAGPPSDAQGHTQPIYAAGSTAPNCGLGAGQWTCEERWHAIAGMVGFRDFTDGAPLANWWTNPDDGNQVAFGRGALGFVAINRSTSPLSRTLQTGLPAGRYCDVVGGDLATGGSSCTGPSVVVGADGTAQVDLAPMHALAVHVGVRVPGG